MSEDKPTIRKLRVLQGLSQTAFAQKAGVSQPTVSHLERGDYSYGYSPKTLKRIADALQVGIEDVLELSKVLEIMTSSKEVQE